MPLGTASPLPALPDGHSQGVLGSALSPRAGVSLCAALKAMGLRYFK